MPKSKEKRRSRSRSPRRKHKHRSESRSPPRKKSKKTKSRSRSRSQSPKREPKSKSKSKPDIWGTAPSPSGSDSDDDPSHESESDSSSSDAKSKKKKKEKKKSGKKEKKSKKSKKSKKKKKKLKEAKAFLKRAQKQKAVGEFTPKGRPTISMDHYFQKSTEFSVWLVSAKKMYFDQLDSAESRLMFSKFIDKWNSDSLTEELYRGVSSSSVGVTGRTGHKWGFAKQMTEQEKWQLENMRDDIETDTRRKPGEDPYADIPAPKKAPSRSTPSIGPAIGPAMGPAMGPAGPPNRPDRRSDAEKEFAKEQQKEIDQRALRLDRKAARQHHEMVMNELVPKPDPGSREAQREAKRAKAAYSRKDDDTSASVDDKTLMGASSSDFQDRLNRRQQYRARKEEEKQGKLDEYKEKERAKMQAMLEKIGMAGKYKLQY